MAGVEIGGAQLRMGLEVEAAGAHEVERLGNAVGQLLVAAGLRRILEEAEHPLMHAGEIGVAAGRERAQQVERRGRLPVGHQLALRIGHARFGGERDVVDDVAAIARQFDAVRSSQSATIAALRTARRCGRPSPPAARRHRSSRPPSAGTRGKSRGCCWRRARQSSRRSRRPAAGTPRPWRRAPAPFSGCGPRRQTPAAERSRAGPRRRPMPWHRDIAASAAPAWRASCRVSNARTYQLTPEQKPLLVGKF